MCVYISVCVGSEGPCRKSNIKFFIIRELLFFLLYIKNVPFKIECRIFCYD